MSHWPAEGQFCIYISGPNLVRRSQYIYRCYGFELNIICDQNNELILYLLRPIDYHMYVYICTYVHMYIRIYICIYIDCICLEE